LNSKREQMQLMNMPS